METGDNRSELPDKFIVDGIEITIAQARIIILSTYGLQRKQMADLLNISKNTIDTHLDRIYKLLKVQSQPMLMIWAVRNGLYANGHLQGYYLFKGYAKVPW